MFLSAAQTHQHQQTFYYRHPWSAERLVALPLIQRRVIVRNRLQGAQPGRGDLGDDSGLRLDIRLCSLAEKKKSVTHHPDKIRL